MASRHGPLDYQEPLRIHPFLLDSNKHAVFIHRQLHSILKARYVHAHDPCDEQQSDPPSVQQACLCRESKAYQCAGGYLLHEDGPQGSCTRLSPSATRCASLCTCGSCDPPSASACPYDRLQQRCPPSRGSFDLHRYHTTHLDRTVFLMPEGRRRNVLDLSSE